MSIEIRKNLDPKTATLDSILPRVANYNPDSTEMHSEALIVGGNPDGMINLVKPSLGWVNPLIERMQNNTWFSKEPDLSKERAQYRKLADAQKRMYNITLAGLSGNDSLQTSNLAKNIMPYISDPTVRALLARQDWEEALHSLSYSVMSTDVYEGDILYDSAGRYYKVEWDYRDTGWVGIDLYNNNKKKLVELLLNYAIVVGNIWENPELLKD